MDELEFLKGRVYGLTLVLGNVLHALAQMSKESPGVLGPQRLAESLDDPLSNLPPWAAEAARANVPFVRGLMQAHEELGEIVRDRAGDRG